MKIKTWDTLYSAKELKYLSLCKGKITINSQLLFCQMYGP